MKKILLWSLVSSLYVACGDRSHDDKNPAPTPSSPSPLGPASVQISLMDKLTVSSAQLTAYCKSLGDRSWRYDLNFNEKKFAGKLMFFKDSTCTKTDFIAYQTGELLDKSSANETRSKVGLVMGEFVFRFEAEVPKAFQSCAQKAESLSKVIHIARASDCGVDSSSAEMTAMKTETRTVEAQLNYLKEFIPGFGDETVAMNLTPLSTPIGTPSPEVAICYDLTSHVYKDKICTAIEFTKASEDSLIEFEKGTGLYPKLVKNADLFKAPQDKAQTVKVYYQFPCEIFKNDKLKEFRNFPFAKLKNAETGFSINLSPKADGTEEMFQVNAKGDLILVQESRYLGLGASESLGDFRVDTKCQLKIRTELVD